MVTSAKSSNIFAVTFWRTTLSSATSIRGLASSKNLTSEVLVGIVTTVWWYEASSVFCGDMDLLLLPPQHKKFRHQELRVLRACKFRSESVVNLDGEGARRCGEGNPVEGTEGTAGGVPVDVRLAGPLASPSRYRHTRDELGELGKFTHGGTASMTFSSCTAARPSPSHGCVGGSEVVLGWAGIVNQKWDPFWYSESTPTCPPIRSTSCLTMLSPRPAP
mmetsp:Transcript_53356/g.88744  ORF Transcript_53356/g.88744 Transcript_53356/m.88744 type:complete len:219 (+) Transcript_53356:199-855(+)